MEHKTAAIVKKLEEHNSELYKESERLRQALNDLESKSRTDAACRSGGTLFGDFIKGSFIVIASAACGALVGANITSPTSAARLKYDVYSSKPFIWAMKNAPSNDEQSLRELARKVAYKNRIDPLLFEALIETESGFNPDARSSKGAIGLAQVMPFWAKELGYTHVSQLWTPYDNLNAGALILSGYLRDNDGDVERSLQQYNGGRGCIGRCAESLNYSASVLIKYAKKVFRSTGSAAITGK